MRRNILLHITAFVGFYFSEKTEHFEDVCNLDADSLNPVLHVWKIKHAKGPHAPTWIKVDPGSTSLGSSKQL